MKKYIINGSIFLLVIVLVVSLCSCSRSSTFEGLSASNNVLSLSRDTSGLGKITSTDKLTTTNVLFSTGNPIPSSPPKESDADSTFCAFIEDTSLKIAKRSQVSVVAPAKPSTWTVIWNSSIAGYTGNELKMADNVLNLDTMQLGVGTAGSYAKLTVEGDLVICNAGGVAVWSLVASQLSLITAATNDYLKRGSRIYKSVDIEALNASYENFNSYIKKINLTDKSTLDTYKKLARIRNKMDFDIQELSGLSNSKINASKEMLQSGMYLNLGITILVTSVFILISTR
jgi:hypothetical protein